ncbi:MAG: cytochrome c biogenesis protein ResB [Methanosarcinaceae archaeon]|nr:cytochrome c biogenesis protein ResB [Methanosarcinaceae archaeon]
MKFVSILLIMLGVIISLGTLIPQGLSESGYANAYGNIVASIILFFGLNKIYSSILIYVLFSSLCILSLLCGFYHFYKKRSKFNLGFLLIHISLIIIFSGAFISGATCVREYVELIPGESFTFSDDSILKLNSFNLIYYENSSQVKQYISDVSYTESGSVNNYSIKVNHPLRKHFVKIYQNSYGNYLNTKLSSGDILKIFDGTYVFVKDDSGLIYTLSAFYKKDIQSIENWILVLRQNESIIDMKRVSANESFTLGSFDLNTLESGHYSGLEYKRDLGVPVIYFGFFVLIFGLLYFYFISLLNFIKKRKITYNNFNTHSYFDEIQ